MFGNFFHTHHLKRQLTLWPLVFIGVGNTLAASIFVLLGEGVKIAGGLLPISFLLGALIALCAACVYAKIASINPTSGSDINFLFHILPHKSLAFSISWLIIFGDLSFIALNALGIGIYLHTFLPVPIFFISSFIIIAITLLNISGVKKTSLLESWLTIFLLFCLSILVLMAIGSIDIRLWINNLPTNTSHFPWAILAATALIYSSYIGYEDIISVAGEVTNPRKTIPRALTLTVFITAALYTGMALILVSHLTNQEIVSQHLPLLAMAEKIKFPVAILYLNVIIAVITTLITMLLIASRKLYALLTILSPNSSLLKLNRHEVPYKLIIIICLISLLILLSGSINYLSYITNSVYLVGLSATIFGLFYYEKHHSHLIKNAYQIPFYPWSVYLVIIFALILIIMSDHWALIGILAWLLIGLLIYSIANHYLHHH